jgi:hypothetical protein
MMMLSGVNLGGFGNHFDGTGNVLANGNHGGAAMLAYGGHALGGCSGGAMMPGGLDGGDLSGKDLSGLGGDLGDDAVLDMFLKDGLPEGEDGF